MPSSQIERKLAAIMFTDIAGYTEQMSKDQDVAFALLEEKRNAFKPLVKEHNGTLIKEMGDGTLSHYPTAVDASACSLNLQQRIKDNHKLNVRIGIHLGDTMFKDNDVFGDGVNIASRLESMSPAGGILVSKNVYDELLSREGFEGVSLGLQSLKGVGRLVEVYALKGDHLTVPNPDDYTENKIDVHSDDEVPSIAIIPFENKGADEDIFYAYGISVDLISDVTSAGLIRVASKKQIDEARELQQNELAQKLDVRYIANGELWRMGDMFQLSIELYDTKDKKVIWSDRWQENWENLTIIKGNLSDGLLKALNTKPKEQKKIDTTNPKAYEFYLKATHKYEKRKNIDDTKIARRLLQKAVELDNNLLRAKILLGWTFYEMGDYAKSMKIYSPALKQAEDIGDKQMMGISLMNIGILYSTKGENIKALNFFTRSFKICEEFGDKSWMGTILYNIGILYSESGEYNKALKFFTRSLKICEELDDKSGIGASLGIIGNVYIYKGLNDKALKFFTRSLKICEELGDKNEVGTILMRIGNVYAHKFEYDKAMDYHTRSLRIKEEIGNKKGVGESLSNIGNLYGYNGFFDKAIDYYTRSLRIQEELIDKYGMGINFGNIGSLWASKGNYVKALDYQKRSLDIREEIADKNGVGHSLSEIGTVYYSNGDYKKTIEYLEKSLAIKKEIGLGADSVLETTTYLYLAYKHLSKNYDAKEIHSLIKKTENIEFEINLRLYLLLEDKLYLETAYNQIQDKASAMEEKLSKKFLRYPIPNAIVEEWEKVSST